MILQWDNFRPLANIPAKGTKEGICDLKFTPGGAPAPLLAAASRDQKIYIYAVAKGYQCGSTSLEQSFDLLDSWFSVYALFWAAT
jgi:hypothetical protein